MDVDVYVDLHVVRVVVVPEEYFQRIFPLLLHLLFWLLLLHYDYPRRFSQALTSSSSVIAHVGH